jgi:5-methylcytosine-specific restriction protein B
MTAEEINNGVELLCRTSLEVRSYYEDDQNIVNVLNDLDRNTLEECLRYYNNRSGVVVDIRKDIIKKLLTNYQFTVESLQELIDQFKVGKENKFRSYRETYSIVFPIITIVGHKSQRDFVKLLTRKLIADLEIEKYVKQVSVDFQGARQQGSDRFWVAIYNKQQENQSIGVQFFYEFFEGIIGYGVYKHENQNYLRPRVTTAPQAFSYDNMLTYFKESKQLLLDDIPKFDSLKTFEIGGHRLYKVSHGHFKTKKASQIIEAFKTNNWIVLHEDTGKGQADAFKNELKEGDFVYITIGSKELVSIAKVKNNDWDFVPNDVVGTDGWIYRQVEVLQPAIRKGPKELTSKKWFYPSANSTFIEIKHEDLEEANNLLFKPYFNAEFISNIKDQEKTDIMDFKLNQILFGPPGTGKTYNTINKAIEIIEGKRLETSRTEIKQKFDEKIQNGQIVFTTFHQSMSYEDFIEGIKPADSSVYSHFLEYEVQDGIFKRIVKDALSNYQASLMSPSPDEDFHLRLEMLVEDWHNDPSISFPLKTAGNDFTITGFSNYSISFKKASGGEGHTLSKRTLKEIFLGKRELKERGVDIYYPAVIDRLKKYQVKREVENLKKFVLVIDEINRGNISQIFGELITLIESSKRIGTSEALDLTLTYSKDSFSVPPNLYIIGTMNTADRSVEALDTALRRRFSFVEMLPDPDIIRGAENSGRSNIAGIELADLLIAINSRLRVLLDKDHLIGHSYFLGIDNLEKLKGAFVNSVIPLLQEYFYGDDGKIGLVLGKGFFKDKTELTEVSFADFEYDFDQEISIYEMKDILNISDADFIDALKTLLRIKNDA